MKTRNTFVGTVEGDLDPQQTIVMSLDDTDAGRAHIISLMTDLYSDKELAVLREYSTNALDSHIQAGNSAPIEVFTPTTLSPVLTIIDHGVGLSINDLENVYSKYGASTKRDSDDYNGTLGVGGKSALTYANQFTVIAVKDGVKSQIVVTRNEIGIGVMEVIDTRATTEPNGVTIKIPTTRQNDFLEKAKRFFYFWQPGTILLNGEEPNLLVNETEHTKIGDNVFTLSQRSYSHNSDIIVMGNVAYDVGDKPFTQILTENQYYNKTVVFVEMGAITFAPSRESVSDTQRTRDTIVRVKDEIRANLKQSILDDLKSATSYSEAFRRWIKWNNAVGSKNIPADVSYRGRQFQGVIRQRHSYLWIGQGRYNWQKNTHADKAGNNDVVPMHELLADKTLVVTGYTNVNAPAAGARRKVKEYLSNHPDVTMVMFFDTMPGAPWTDDVPSVDWSIINAIKLTASSNGGGRVGTIPVLLMDLPNSKRWVETKQLDANRPIVYLSPVDLRSQTRYGQPTAQYNINAINALGLDVQVVQLGANRFAKFVRENPTAVKLSTYMENGFVKALKDSFTADELWYLDHDVMYRQVAREMAQSSDPVFQRLAGIKVDVTRAEWYNRYVPATKELSKDYPLLDLYSVRNHKNHSILYINAVRKGN